MRTRARTRGEGGFNLIEVLIAMALLSTVLLSIVTLFFMGRSNVYSGKQLTRATSVAVHANEDLAALTGGDFFSAFNVVKGNTTSSNTVGGIAYAGSIIRTTTADAGGANDPRGYLTRWKSFVGQDRMSKGKVTLIMMPTDLSDAADITTARIIQVRIVTEWNEPPNRPRSVFIDTTKFNRSLQ